jgi:hypothetical protein
MLHSKLSNFLRVIPINIPVSLGEVLIHSFHHYQLVYYHKIDTKSQSRPHDNLAEIIIFLWVFLWFSPFSYGFPIRIFYGFPGRLVPAAFRLVLALGRHVRHRAKGHAQLGAGAGTGVEAVAVQAEGVPGSQGRRAWDKFCRWCPPSDVGSFINPIN